MTFVFILQSVVDRFEIDYIVNNCLTVTVNASVLCITMIQCNVPSMVNNNFDIISQVVLTPNKLY